MHLLYEASALISTGKQKNYRKQTMILGARRLRI